MTERPPITCHVLDTTIGRPGAGIPVSLTYLGAKGQSQSSGTTFTATTNDDGRVTQWTAEGSSAGSTTTLEDIFASGAGAAGAGPLRWVLGFDTEAYFARRGVEAFFAEVEVKFVTRKEQIERKEHFHVPVLLGPFGYTTYRGS